LQHHRSPSPIWLESSCPPSSPFSLPSPHAWCPFHGITLCLVPWVLIPPPPEEDGGVLRNQLTSPEMLPLHPPSLRTPFSSKIFFQLISGTVLRRVSVSTSGRTVPPSRACSFGGALRPNQSRVFFPATPHCFRVETCCIIPPPPATLFYAQTRLRQWELSL